MGRSKLVSAVRLILAFLCVAGLAVAASAAEVVVSGTVPVSTEVQPGVLSLPGTITAYRVYTPVSSVAAAVDAQGAFTMSLTPGPWVFLANSGGTTSVESVGYVMVPAVKKGRKPPKVPAITFRVIGPASRSASADTRIGADSASRQRRAPGGLPTGPVVSVGRIAYVDAQGDALLQSDGREFRLDAPFITDLIAASEARCPITVVVDPDSRNYAEINQELRLRSTRFVRASQRVSYKKSLKALKLWAPRYRLQGTVVAQSFDSFDLTVKLQLIDLSTGQPVCTKEYTTTRDAIVFGANGLSKVATRDIVKILCGDPLPSVIQGSYSGTFEVPVLGATETFSGTITFTLQNREVYEQFPPAPGSGVYALYIATAVTIDWSIEGGAPCSFSGEASATLAAPASFIELEVNPARCEARRYVISTGFTVETPATITITCGGEPTQSPKFYGGTIMSPPEPADHLRVAGGRLVGSHSNGPETWSWTLDSID